jgi:hypothetical protein
MNLAAIAKKARSALFVADGSETLAEGEELNIDDLLASQEKAKTADQLVQKFPGANLSDINVPADAVDVSKNAPMDFKAVYKAAGIVETQFGAEDFLGMIKELPAELPLSLRRQTVNVSLTALGKTTGTSAEGIVADATSKITALNTFIQNLEKRTLESNQKEIDEIAELEKQIEDKKSTIVKNNTAFESAQRQCQAEGERIDDIIEFFQVPAPSIPATNTDPTIQKLKTITEGNN